MEISQLYQGLFFLACSTGIIVILVGVMLLILGINLYKLITVTRETVTVVKTEIEPTLKNINKSVAIVSDVIIGIDNVKTKIKNMVNRSPLKIFSKLSSITGTVSKGFWNGISTAFKMFSKKK